MGFLPQNKLQTHTFSEYVRFHASDFTQSGCHGANTPELMHESLHTMVVDDTM
jgi:hypothetical protein